MLFALGLQRLPSVSLALSDVLLTGRYRGDVTELIRLTQYSHGAG